MNGVPGWAWVAVEAVTWVLAGLIGLGLLVLAVVQVTR